MWRHGRQAAAGVKYSFFFFLPGHVGHKMSCAHRIRFGEMMATITLFGVVRVCEKYCGGGCRMSVGASSLCSSGPIASSAFVFCAGALGGVCLCPTYPRLGSREGES